MRSRKEIEDDGIKMKPDKEAILYNQDLMIEVLLDIREELIKINEK